VIDVNDEW
nr:RecName: Full=Plastidial lipid-associated protein [Brassica napus]